MTIGRDDAPATTTKISTERDAAVEALGGKGDQLVGQSVTVNRARSELYDFWRDFRNLPSFLDNVEEITILSPTRSHWVVKAPGGFVEWDAVITEDLPGERLSWQSQDGADVPNSGTITFRDAPGRGTIVTTTIVYELGFVGKIVAKMFQREPAIQARRDLRRFRQLMETGEVATAARTFKQLEEEKA